MPLSQTPGVYVDALITQAAEVQLGETAVPAFIGYTEKISHADGSLINAPVVLTSPEDYHEIFGGGPPELSLDVVLDPDRSYRLVSYATPDQRYYLYDAIRMYFDNGGTACLVVSVGQYGSAVVPGDETVSNAAGLRTGLEALRLNESVTLLLFPDAVSLSGSDLGALQQMALQQCADLQDRFSIFDVQETTSFSQGISDHRNQIGTRNLKYGATYTPYLQYAETPVVSYRYLTFSDGTNSIDVRALTPDATLNQLVTDLDFKMNDQDTAVGDVNSVTGVSNLDLRGTWNTLKQTLQSSTGGAIAANYAAMINFVAELSLLFPAWVDSAGTPLREKALIKDLVAQFGRGFDLATENFIAFAQNPDIVAQIGPAPSFTAFDGKSLLSQNVANIPADTTVYGNDAPSVAGTSLPALEGHFLAAVQAVQNLLDLARRYEENAQAALYAQHPVFRALIPELQFHLSLTPPSGAVAGVYAARDRAVGPWQAPANVALNRVNGLAYEITNGEQEQLNVDATTGKSINAIRAFHGRGIRVWGARTLDGNSNEWRYVPVRRLFLAIETALRAAIEPQIFEPNEARTWFRIKRLARNFLTDLWRAGALAAATLDEAFFVKVGLGETMTAQDVAEGRMIVEIGIAAVRPAEFIVLRFVESVQ
ncbi:MAG: phage tail sheath C-terminal domain-containing protein [Bacteroidota bacterium]